MRSWGTIYILLATETKSCHVYINVNLRFLHTDGRKATDASVCAFDRTESQLIQRSGWDHTNHHLKTPEERKKKKKKRIKYTKMTRTEK